MRKSLIISVLALALSAGAYAQDKKDMVYGPQEGSWALSVGLNPFTDYLGNMFNNSTNNSFEDLNGETIAYDKKTTPLTTISGKYMFTDELGIKANIGLKFRNDTKKAYVVDQAAVMQDPFSEAKVVDQQKLKSSNASLAVAVERRLTSNKRRLQAYVDGGLVWSFELESVNYKYGNVITPLNQTPIVSSLSGYDYVSSALPNCRKVSNNVGKTLYHNFGIFGTIGVEFFITPAISLGAEMNISAIYTFRGDHSSEYEGYNVVTNNVEKYVKVDEPSSSAFEFGTKNIGANLTMSFYF